MENYTTNSTNSSMSNDTVYINNEESVTTVSVMSVMLFVTVLATLLCLIKFCCGKYFYADYRDALSDTIEENEEIDLVPLNHGVLEDPGVQILNNPQIDAAAGDEAQKQLTDQQGRIRQRTSGHNGDSSETLQE